MANYEDVSDPVLLTVSVYVSLGTVLLGYAIYWIFNSYRHPPIQPFSTVWWAHLGFALGISIIGAFQRLDAGRVSEVLDDERRILVDEYVAAHGGRAEALRSLPKDLKTRRQALLKKPD